MKSTTILCIAAVALLFASCSKNEVGGNGAAISNDPSRIGFGVNTGSRALDSELADLEFLGTTDGVKITQVLNGTGTQVQGLYEDFAYAGGAWNWKTDPKNDKFKWPTTAENGVDYPMTFYASYPTVTPEFVNKEWAVSIAPALEDQTDYLAATSLVTKAPSNGKAPLLFKHILSKILFNVKTATDVTVEIASLKVVNVQDETSAATAPKYDLLAGAWANPIITAAANATKSYPYFVSFGSTQEITTASESDLKRVSSEEDGALMLMPQQGTAKWDVAAFKALAKTTMEGYTAAGKTPAQILAAWNTDMATAFAGSYVEVVYSVRTTVDAEFIIGQRGKFIRVGYPLDLDYVDANAAEKEKQQWAPNKQYSYNIELGTKAATGGILLDPYYSDNNGGGTETPVDNPSTVKPGDPISSGEYIGFDLTVGNWEKQDNAIK